MTTAVVHLPDQLKLAILDHCLSGTPYEACGLLEMNGRQIVAIHPTDNERSSSHSYEVPPSQHYTALMLAERRGHVIGGVFHSHPSSPPIPSSVDIARALEPGWVYLIVGSLDATPELRAWSIRDGHVSEIGIADRSGL